LKRGGGRKQGRRGEAERELGLGASVAERKVATRGRKADTAKLVELGIRPASGAGWNGDFGAGPRVGVHQDWWEWVVKASWAGRGEADADAGWGGLTSHDGRRGCCAHAGAASPACAASFQSNSSLLWSCYFLLESILFPRRSMASSYVGARLHDRGCISAAECCPFVARPHRESARPHQCGGGGESVRTSHCCRRQARAAWWGGGWVSANGVGDGLSPDIPMREDRAFPQEHEDDIEMVRPDRQLMHPLQLSAGGSGSGSGRHPAPARALWWRRC
jgi:hypothetical protein